MSSVKALLYLSWLKTAVNSNNAMASSEKLPKGTGAAPGQETGGQNGGESRRLYDRIAARVSLSTVNIIIAVTAVLIVLLFILGVLTASP